MRGLLNELLHISAATAAGRPATISLGRGNNNSCLTYRELHEAILARSSLIRRQLEPHSVIAIAGRGAQFVIDYFATLEANHIAVPTPEDSEYSPSASALANIGVGATFRNGVLEPTTGQAAWKASLDVTDPAVVLFTSGTTGLPKAILHTHTSLVWGVWNMASIAVETLQRSTVTPTTADELIPAITHRENRGTGQLRFLSAMPLHTIAGLATLHRALLLGDAVVLGGGASRTTIVSQASKTGATNLGLSPLLAELLVRRYRNGHPPNHRLITIGIGGSRVDASTAASLEQVTGSIVTIGYGSTELGGVVATTRPLDPVNVRHTSVGRAVADTQLRIRHDDNVDGGGHLECRSRAQMAGTILHGRYSPSAGAWIATGDLADIDDGDNLRILGRADEMILRGGRRIDPQVVEQALGSHEAVERAAVIGVPSTVSGETDVFAYAVLRAGFTASPFELRSHCGKILPPWEVPKTVRITPALPLTADGSVRRHVLADGAPSHPTSRPDQ